MPYGRRLRRLRLDSVSTPDRVLSFDDVEGTILSEGQLLQSVSFVSYPKERVSDSHSSVRVKEADVQASALKM